MKKIWFLWCVAHFSFEHWNGFHGILFFFYNISLELQFMHKYIYTYTHIKEMFWMYWYLICFYYLIKWFQNSIFNAWIWFWRYKETYKQLIINMQTNAWTCIQTYTDRETDKQYGCVIRHKNKKKQITIITYNTTHIN